MAIEPIIDLPEEELLRRLGALTIAQSALPGRIDTEQDLESDRFAAFLDDEEKDDPGFLLALGKRTLRYVSIGLHKILCLQADANVSAQMKVAVESGKTGLATYLVSQLTAAGFDHATAIIVAALIASVLVAAGGTAVCTAWSDYNRSL